MWRKRAILSQCPPKEFCLSGESCLHTIPDRISECAVDTKWKLAVSFCYVCIPIAFERKQKFNGINFQSCFIDPTNW